MDFSLTEEQELLLASIRELITSNFPEEYFRIWGGSHFCTVRMR